MSPPRVFTFEEHKILIQTGLFRACAGEQRVATSGCRTSTSLERMGRCFRSATDWAEKSSNGDRSSRCFGPSGRFKHGKVVFAVRLSVRVWAVQSLRYVNYSGIVLACRHLTADVPGDGRDRLFASTGLAQLCDQRVPVILTL
jgi:hypothetical protein